MDQTGLPNTDIRDMQTFVQQPDDSSGQNESGGQPDNRTIFSAGATEMELQSTATRIGHV